MQLKLSAKKIGALMLVGIISLVGAGIALAADQSSSQPNAPGIHASKLNPEKISAIYQSVLDGLVNAGTITRAQADTITASMPPKDGKERAFGKNKDPWSKMVADGTITQAQADAINQAMKSAREARKSLTDVMAELVSAGTITQTQADAILACMPPKDGKERAFDKNKCPWIKLVTDGTITQAQADAINQAMKSAREARKSLTDVMAELVSAGTITQTQADAILACKPAKDGKERAIDKNKGPWSKMVSDGTITQAQADAINQAMKSAREARKSLTDVIAELVSAGTITQAQADAIIACKPAKDGKERAFDKNKGPWIKLVTDGTITQAQADAIWSALKAAMAAAWKSE